MAIIRILNRKKQHIFVLILFISIFSCSKFSLSPSQQSKYNYKAYDNAGELGISGLLTLNFKDSPDLSGKWEFSSENDSLDMGAQVGEGELEGTIQGDTLMINLHPGYADHNVFLQGKINKGEITGKWWWITFVGVTSQGTYTATKKR